MWLPLISRTAARLLMPSVPPSVALTQGPAALTIAFARTVRSAPLRSSRSVAIQPLALARARRDDAGAGQDRGAALAGIHGVEHDQAAVLDPAVGIDEAAGQPLLQRRAEGELRRSTAFEPGSVRSRAR